MELVQNSVAAVLNSRISGQIHDGDTLGVWNFDDELHSGIFPLQSWRDADAAAMTSLVTGFIKQQPAGKVSHLDKALAGIMEVSRVSDSLNIFLYCTGAEPFKGTPFDQEINSELKSHLRAMGRKKHPFVVVFQSRGGQMLAYTFTALPWPVMIPLEPAPAAPTETAVPVVKAPAPPPIAPTNARPPVVSRPAAENTAVPKSTTVPPPPKTNTNAPARELVLSTNAVSVPPAAQVTPVNLLAPVPAPTLVITNSVAPPFSNDPPVTPAVQPKPVATESVFPPVKKTNALAVPVVPMVEAKVPLVTARPEPPVAKTNATPPAEKPLEGASPANSSAVPPQPAAEVFVGSPPRSGRGRLFLGLGLLGAGGVLALWLFNRPRTGRSSLITQSMNDSRKRR